MAYEKFRDQIHHRILKPSRSNEVESHLRTQKTSFEPRSSRQLSYKHDPERIKNDWDRRALCVCSGYKVQKPITRQKTRLRTEESSEMHLRFSLPPKAAPLASSRSKFCFELSFQNLWNASCSADRLGNVRSMEYLTARLSIHCSKRLKYRT